MYKVIFATLHDEGKPVADVIMSLLLQAVNMSKSNHFTPSEYKKENVMMKFMVFLAATMVGFGFGCFEGERVAAAQAFQYGGKGRPR